MYSLTHLDYGIIIGFLSLTVVVGLYMTKKASSSLDDYFLGGRTMPWYLLGIAGMSNWFDMTGTMIITSFLYMLGPRGLFIEFRGGAVLILAFLLCYTGKWHRRSGCMTGAEWMIYRFGQGRDAEVVRVITAVMSLVATVGMVAYFVRGTSLFVGMMLPYPQTECTAILIGVTTLYTMCAGFYAVVFTDLVQGAIVMVSCFVVAFIAWHMTPNASHLAAVAKEVTGNSQWITSAPSWHTTMPKGYEAYQSLIMFSAFYLFRNILGGVGTGAESRYFAAKSDRDCGLQSLLQGVTVTLRWPLMIGFAVMGIYLVHSMYPDASVISRAQELILSYYPHIDKSAWHDLTSKISSMPSHYPTSLISSLKSTLGPNWVAKLQLVGFEGTVNPERILPAVIMYSVPVGLKGLLIVAMIAAMKSAFGGMLNGGSAFFVKDIYQNLIRPSASNRELITASYVSTIALVAVGFVMGMGASSINELWGWIIMGLGAGGLAPALLRLYWWRCNAWGMIGGMLLGTAGAVVQRIVAPGMVEWQQFIIMTTLSFAGTIGVSLRTVPTPMEKLTHFYKTTRPFGIWGPVKAMFSPEEVKHLTRENRNDIISVPFALLAQVTVFLLPMQLVIKAYSSFWQTLPLFLVGALGLYWFWWRNLPPEDVKPAESRVQSDRIPAEAEV
ncbi:MAG: sodium:solute symporter family transporter [Armatimonadota bacterium]